MEFNISKLSFLKLTGKKVTIILFVSAVIFLLLAITASFLNKNPNAILLRPGEQAKPEPGKVKTKSGCGNNLCEPGLGETKENCPKDCTAGN